MKARQGLCRLSKGIQTFLNYIDVDRMRVDAGLKQTNTETSVFVSVRAEDGGKAKTTELTPA